MNKDVLSGIAVLAIAALYYTLISQIADSSLEDAVGATGLPRILAILLALVGLAIAARGLFASYAARAERASLAASSVGVGDQVQRAEQEEGEDGNAPLPRALGFLLFGAVYVAILPYAGYLVSVALLIAGIALYEGARKSWRVPAFALGGAVFYWLIFVKLLGVHQPVGLLFSGIVV